MILAAFAQILHYFGDVRVLLFITGGVIVGLIFGIVPGIGPLNAIALVLPFAFAMRPEDALPLMVALGSVGYTGGAITAILLNVPGTGPNAAALIDGFPMSQKGEAGRALGAALTSSGAGGVVAVFAALGMVFLVVPMVMAIRSADMVFVVLLGIAFITSLATGAVVKGVVSGGLGLLLSFVGYQAMTGVPRFTFGSLYLYDGIRLIPIALGLFAIPEMVILAARGGAIAETVGVPKGMRDVWEGAKDVFHCWSAWLRGVIIGYIVGIIPGIGAETASFVAYGEAKRTSKHPERFGSGIVEGVIAPQSADNACVSGALLTTLALGIPGSATMALLLGGLVMVGLIPGPEMITKHLDLSLTLLVVVAVSNIMGSGICLLLAKYLAKIAYIPSRILVPLVLVITFVGIFAYKQDFKDLMACLVIGALGLAMRRLGFNRPALFLGYIMGSLLEGYLFIALRVAGPLFFLRPISLTLIFAMIALFTFGPIKNLFQRRRGVNRA